MVIFKRKRREGENWKILEFRSWKSLNCKLSSPGCLIIKMFACTEVIKFYRPCYKPQYKKRFMTFLMM